MENFTSVLQWVETAVLQTYFSVISIKHQFTVPICWGHKYLMKMQGVLLEHLEMSQRAVLSWEYPLRQVPPLQSQTPNP